MKTLLSVALTSHLLDEPPPVSPAVWRELRPHVDGGMGWEAVADWARRWLSTADAEQVGARLALLLEAEGELERLDTAGIIAVSEFDERYPQRWFERLGEKRPPVLFVLGNAALLNEGSIGVVGSRDAGAEDTEFAADLGRAIVENGLAVVSGGAKGVDMVAMNAAYDSGGKSIGFIANSLERLSGSHEMQGPLESGGVCLASPFAPGVGFHVGNAMARNKLVYAHSRATVVVTSSEGSGGTWAGATEALKEGYCPVLVRSGKDASEANLKLIEVGATALESPRELFDLLNSRTAVQESLF